MVAMLMTAFDAGGHEADQSCVAVAGFISNAADWESFDQRWRERLAEDGLTYFRMSEYSQNVGSFVDRSAWTFERRKALIVDLIGIIRSHAYRKFGCVVVNASFSQMDEAVREQFRLTAYVLAGRTCAGSVRQWSLDDGWATVPIAYVFEEGDKGKGKLIERMERDAFPTRVFWPKKDGVKDGIPHLGFTPLQAADILEVTPGG